MRQALLDGCQDTFGIEAHPGQLFLALAVIDKGIGQTQVEYGSTHYLLLQQFVDRRPGTTGNGIVFQSDKQLTGAGPP